MTLMNANLPPPQAASHILGCPVGPSQNPQDVGKSCVSKRISIGLPKILGLSVLCPTLAIGTPHPRHEILPKFYEFPVKADPVPQALPAPAAAPPEPATQKLVATVNGVKIFNHEVLAEAYPNVTPVWQALAVAREPFRLRRSAVVGRGTEAPEVRQRNAQRRALEELIDRELLIIEGRRLGAEIGVPDVDFDIKVLIREQLKITPEGFLAGLKAEGKTWAEFRDSHHRTLMLEAMRQHFTQGIKAPTPEQKRAYIDQHRASLRTGGSVHLHTIAVPQLTGESEVPLDQQRTRQRALIDDIRQKLVTGADFAELARAYSQDSKAPQGGDWGTVDRSSLALEFAELAFSIPVREVSEVFQFRGFHYLMLVGERDQGQLPPAEALDQLVAARLETEMKDQALEEALAKLRKMAKIVYVDASLRPE